MFLFILLILLTRECCGMESDSVKEDIAALRAQMKELSRTVENGKKREEELVGKLEGLSLKEEETAKIVYGLTLKEEEIKEIKKTVSGLTLKEEETTKKVYGLTIKDEDSAKRIDGLADEVHENHKDSAKRIDSLADEVHENHKREEETALKLNGLCIRDEEMAKKMAALTVEIHENQKKYEEVAKQLGGLATEIKENQIKDKETAKRLGGLAAELKENHKKDEDAAKKVEGLAAEIEENRKKDEKAVEKIEDVTKKEIETATKVEGLTTNVNEYCSMLAKDICGPCQCKDDRRLAKQFFCNCQNLPVKRDCVQYRREGITIDGVYRIHQNNLKVVQVYCDQTTEGGGWTVFQRRLDGSVKFYRNWASYKRGFGDIQHEFWLGNDNLFTMSALVPAGNELRIELEDWEGNTRYAKYQGFQVANEQLSYQLYVSDYSGTAGDGGQGMSYHNGMKFTTLDRDNDNWGGNCAHNDFGGWWYKGCHLVNLNGNYSDYPIWGSGERAIEWYAFHTRPYSLKFVEMKMRRKG